MPLAEIAVVGAGPAGLIAAERLASLGYGVTVYDRMPSPGRKFLMAGRGGLNLTHSEALPDFVTRYGRAAAALAPSLDDFSPMAVRQWADGLGADTFVGSSGRVFPRALKASPLLRAWLRRLDELGVRFAFRQDWIGLDGGALIFRTPENEAVRIEPDAALLALGGASWPRLGSNGAWVDILASSGVPITPLEPANGGFRVRWSELFAGRFAGVPLKNVAIRFRETVLRGEAMITAYGIEGGVIYALSAALREAIGSAGNAKIEIDLLPNLTVEQAASRIEAQKSGQSLSNLLRKALHLPPVAINLLRETFPEDRSRDAASLALRLKAVPLALVSTSGLDRAISTAGGIAWEALDDHLMLKALPGRFAAGEMLDWEAPTGGYLLQASLSTGVRAAIGIDRWLQAGHLFGA